MGAGRRYWRLEAAMVAIDVVALFVLRPARAAFGSAALFSACALLTMAYRLPTARSRVVRWATTLLEAVGMLGALAVWFGQPDDVQTAWLVAAGGLIAAVFALELRSGRLDDTE